MKNKKRVIYEIYFPAFCKNFKDVLIEEKSAKINWTRWLGCYIISIESRG